MYFFHLVFQFNYKYLFYNIVHLRTLVSEEPYKLLGAVIRIKKMTSYYINYEIQIRMRLGRLKNYSMTQLQNVRFRGIGLT